MNKTSNYMVLYFSTLCLFNLILCVLKKVCIVLYVASFSSKSETFAIESRLNIVCVALSPDGFSAVFVDEGLFLFLSLKQIISQGLIL